MRGNMKPHYRHIKQSTSDISLNAAFGRISEVGLTAINATDFTKKASKFVTSSKGEATESRLHPEMYETLCTAISVFENKLQMARDNKITDLSGMIREIENKPDANQDKKEMILVGLRAAQELLTTQYKELGRLFEK